MKLIRDLEKKAKLLRLEGSNSMALLLQEAADRIESLTVEAQTKDCELNSQKGVIQSVRDVFDIRVHDFNLITAIKLTLEKRDIEQEDAGFKLGFWRGFEVAKMNPDSDIQSHYQWQVELRNQAKELKS